jgi:polysaccharide biosynthesis PFTS motif protein
MVNCARLAVDNPDIDFVVKNKEPQYTDTICASEAFMDIYRQTDGNFRFEDRPRHDYMDLLCSSDIIIAVGFTTPGFEALMLNKRIIYYNELKYGGQAYRELPDSIARNDEELADLFKKAVNDYEMYAENIAEVLKSLDPFRDGRARERICGILIGK